LLRVPLYSAVNAHDENPPQGTCPDEKENRASGVMSTDIRGGITKSTLAIAKTLKIKKKSKKKSDDYDKRR
jgi:hypothetical protein